jgi:hypothetical protein
MLAIIVLKKKAIAAKEQEISVLMEGLTAAGRILDHSKEAHANMDRFIALEKAKQSG